MLKCLNDMIKKIPTTSDGHLNGCFSLNVINNYFSECMVGFYGVNCLQNCSMTCGIPGNCDRITGYCNGGCQRGWRGVRCEEGKG